MHNNELSLCFLDNFLTNKIWDIYTLEYNSIYRTLTSPNPTITQPWALVNKPKKLRKKPQIVVGKACEWQHSAYGNNKELVHKI